LRCTAARAANKEKFSSLRKHHDFEDEVYDQLLTTHNDNNLPFQNLFFKNTLFRIMADPAPLRASSLEVAISQDSRFSFLSAEQQQSLLRAARGGAFRLILFIRSFPTPAVRDQLLHHVLRVAESFASAMANEIATLVDYSTSNDAKGWQRLLPAGDQQKQFSILFPQMARIGANASLSKRDRATSLRLTLAESGNAGLNLSECASVINCTNYKGIMDLIALITERDLDASEIKARVNFEILTRRDAGAPSVTRRVRLEPRDITTALENATKPTSTLNPSQ
jgi:hypothetical protein